MFTFIPSQLNKEEMNIEQNIPKRIFLNIGDPEDLDTDNFPYLEEVSWSENKIHNADIEYVHLDSLQSNPSEFGMVKKEDYDRVVNGLKNAGAASLKLYTKAKDNADQLAEALENITYSPVPYNQREREIWMDTARRTAQTALTNYEQSNA